jgi:hypothetical protein
MSNSKVLIVFSSSSGAAEALANAIAEGAWNAGVEIRLRRARELAPPKVMARAARTAGAMYRKYQAPTEADADWADAIVFCAASRSGIVCGELGYASPRELVLSTEKAEPDRVLAAVRDSRPGPAPESLQRLFRPVGSVANRSRARRS